MLELGANWINPHKNDDFGLFFALFRGIFVNVFLTPPWIEKNCLDPPLEVIKPSILLLKMLKLVCSLYPPKKDEHGLYLP